MVLKIVKSRGVAEFAPLSSGIPRAEKLPIQIPTVYRWLYPMLHASRRPYDVPVFQAIFGRCTVLSQFRGKSGRFTLDRVSLIMNAAEGLSTRCPRRSIAVSAVSSSA